MDHAPTREQLLHLLAEASELEHNLLCSYLFALFSLKGEDAPDLEPRERAAVGRWRKSLLSVCVEEMLHLAQVANLAVSIGARPHFNRPNLPAAAGHHPAAIVVELAGFDADTLQHFIHIERPDGSDAPDGDSFAPDGDYRREAVAGMLMPAAPDYKTIGEFYEDLRRAMAAFCAERGERALFVGDASLQMRPEDVKSPSLRVVRDLASATEAIEEIVRQGEGAPGESEDSHFAQFAGIQREFAELAAARPGFAPAYPVGRNPVMRFPPSRGRTHVTHSEAFTLLDAANAAYNFMLRCLDACYQTPWSEASAREGLLGATFKSMRALSALGAELAKLPASRDGAGGAHAGVSFAIARATEGLRRGGAVALLAERASELAKGVGPLPLPAARKADLAEIWAQVGRSLEPAACK